MLDDPFGTSLGACRTAVVPACGAPVPHGAPADALGVFQLPLRDTLDFNVDWSAWMAGNSNPALTEVVFSVDPNSPQTPDIVGQAAAPTGRTLVVLAVPLGGKVGDAYWINAQASFGATVVDDVHDIAIPARVLNRRIYVVVIEG